MPCHTTAIPNSLSIALTETGWQMQRSRERVAMSSLKLLMPNAHRLYNSWALPTPGLLSYGGTYNNQCMKQLLSISVRHHVGIGKGLLTLLPHYNSQHMLARLLLNYLQPQRPVILCSFLAILCNSGAAWRISGGLVEHLISCLRGITSNGSCVGLKNSIIIGPNVIPDVAIGLLSGFRMVPKMRRYDRPRSVQPTCEDWQLFLEQPGPEGGCLATPCSWDAVVRHACDPKPMQTTILAAHEEATHDLRGLRWVSKKLPLRKVCPTWSVPSEVWRQALHPTWKIATRHFGVGFAQTQQLSISHFDRLLFRLLVSIRSYDETPVQWQRSQVATLDKHNGKPKCDGVRAINSLDMLGKVFYR